jgi:hypothetical protein
MKNKQKNNSIVSSVDIKQRRVASMLRIDKQINSEKKKRKKKKKKTNNKLITITKKERSRTGLLLDRSLS